ncbi:hypothetical protein KHA93_13570 [Bacillus sp. FJAT-49732]|uniref:Uncharacterized protein n=1 Tax=Lederbergia citrisecunda TaxID=2833583 RepID=A0A942TR94_9BACI|nr:hypothetical protein [Lederbergia citrisecunda]MBS4200662.1 hypothetical protein [Lederbergia citrisecunda]
MSTIVILIVSVNLVLLEKNGSKAERLNFISNWKVLATGDLVETFRTEGVVAPSERNPVFVDPNVTFKGFLVEKGDEVENGTPLFEYATDDLDEQIALLDAEITRLEKEKKSIETFMSDIEKTKRSLPGNRLNPKPVLEDPELEAVVEAVTRIESSGQAREIRTIDQSISEKELELEKVELEIEKYEKQRDVVKSGRKGLTMLSPYEGTVEEISFELNNPVMTIVSEDLLIEGRLGEKVVSVVEEGMRVDVHSNLLEESLSGEVGTVSELPVEKPDVKLESFYPFTVVLEEEDNNLYAGYHVHADIVVDEALDVPVVRSESVLDKRKTSYLWILNRKGMVEKREVDLGLHVGNRIEVISGAEPGEVYVKLQKEIDQAGPFITPLKGGKHIFDEWEKTSFRKKLKYVLVGILQR